MAVYTVHNNSIDFDIFGAKNVESTEKPMLILHSDLQV